METCDVLIVGGGPAGSACAWKLRQHGIDVLVVDKATFPRHKVCGGWITLPVIEELQIDLAHFQSACVLQPIRSFITGMIGGRELETDYGRTVSYGIRRCEFDDYLLSRSGARLRLGEPVRTIRQSGDTWIVNDAIQTKLLIGAGGHFCPVTRQFAPDRHADDSSHAPPLPTVVAQEVEFELSPEQAQQISSRPERPELYFCPDLKGYGWVFRKGNFINIGLGREGESQLSSHISAFVNWLTALGKIPRELPQKFQGHAYYLRTRLRQIDTPPNVLIIGDALGLADQQSGEGIRPAIESGLLAAASILEAQDSSASVSERYRQHMAAQLTPPGPSPLIQHLPSSLVHWAARHMMSRPWFVRRVVLDRWFLHLQQPLLKI